MPDGNTFIKPSTRAESRRQVRTALADYRAVRFGIGKGVRAYFAEKETARAEVRAAVAQARRVAF